MHYSSALEYLGTFAPDNSPLDVAAQQWAGASRVAAVASTGTPVVNGRFRVYNDADQPLSVFIDSIALPDVPNYACDYIAIGDTASIFPPSVCGDQILSRFLHKDERPRFAIAPDLSGNAINLSSTQDIDDVEIDVYNALGAKLIEHRSRLHSGSFERISTNLRRGIYFVTLHAENLTARMQLLLR